MTGYANRLIRLDFDLAEDPADKVYVIMRNPKLIPPGELRAPASKIKTGADGETIDDDDDASRNAMYTVYAKLVAGWRVYDASSLEDDQPLLDFPATAASVAKLPMEIFNAMAAVMRDGNPPKRTASPEAGTSKAS